MQHLLAVVLGSTTALVPGDHHRGHLFGMITYRKLQNTIFYISQT